MPNLGRCNLAGRRSGGALIASLLVLVLLSGIAAASFAASLAHKKEVQSAANRLRALYLAEAAVSESLNEIAIARSQARDVATALGSEAAPMRLKRGRMWSTIQDNGDDTYTVLASGFTNGTERRLQATVAPVVEDVFDHAIFAGNSSGDINYEMRLSGVGAEADLVTGDIYSGNDVTLDDDAVVAGDIYASGTVTGASGRGGVSRQIPDIAGMNYDVNNDVDVAAAFAAGESWQPNALGGSAWELPESDPAHIFRKNPDDRTDETSGTAKDDFFLEDPYMPVTDFTAWNGKAGHTISLSGTMGKPGSSGNEKLYFIDGNLWVHNKPFGRLRFLNSGPGAKVTFVVRGNVYFSDDVLLSDPQNDGLAFIAIKDENEPDSGNVYMGDPRYGTLERMQAYLYAENNFYDYNLDENGSASVELYGNMTAGNHVSIERDFVKSDGSIVHSKLTVDFDDRLKEGEIVLPGLPRTPDRGTGGWRVVLWEEVPIGI